MISKHGVRVGAKRIETQHKTVLKYSRSRKQWLFGFFVLAVRQKHVVSLCTTICSDISLMVHTLASFCRNQTLPVSFWSDPSVPLSSVV